MDLAELLRAAGRRWYVLIAGLILVVGLVMVTLRFVPITYDARSSILLLPPSSSIEKGGNPFLNLGGLDLVAGVLGKSLTDSETAKRIAPPGSKAAYTVAKDPSVSGSVLEVVASNTSPDAAFTTLNAVLNLATEKLNQLQDAAGASEQTHVRLMVITNNTEAEPIIASLARTLIVVIAAGLSATLLLAISIDSMVRRRRTKKADQERERVNDTSPAPPTDRAGRSGPPRDEVPELAGKKH